VRRIVLVLFGLLWAGHAIAQMSGQISIASDNVFRGVSISDSRPSVAAEINYDGGAGWFVGGQAAQTQFYGQGHANPEIVVDAGYVHALGSGLSWEAGATYSTFPNFTFWNYAEGFVGILSDNWNARLYWSPNYFGRHQRTAYAEFNYSHPLGERLRLLAHVGAVHADAAQNIGNSRAFDASLGLGTTVSNVNIQMNWIATNRNSFLYPIATGGDRQEWVLSLAYTF
jgi:uncharacterized protein (TIGR02001 family)